MSTKNEPAPEATPAERVVETVKPEDKPTADEPRVAKRVAVADDARAKALAALTGKREAKPAKKRPEAPAAAPAKAAPAPEPDDEGDEEEAEEAPAAARAGEPAKTPDPKTPAEPGAKPTPQQAADEDRRARVTIAREEQRVRREREELKTEREKFTRELADAKKTLDTLARIKSGDVLGGLGELGLSYEQVTAAAMRGKAAGANATDVRKIVEERIAEATKPLKDELDAVKRARDEANMRAAVAEYHGTIRREVLAEKSDRWELLQVEHDDFAGAVYDEIRTQWEQDGRPLNRDGSADTLTVAQAADRIEARLLKAHERRMKASKLNRRTEAEEDPKHDDDAERPLQAGEKGDKTDGNRKRPSKTLTNTDASSVARNGKSNDPAVYRQRALAVMRSSRAANS